MRADVPVGIIEESKVSENARLRRPKPKKKKDPTENVLADVKLAQK